MTNFHNEIHKWNSIYSSIELSQEDEALKKFNLEFANEVKRLLPSGGKTIEIGSGGGWQSLALSKTGIFSPTLLDFSIEALKFSKRLFQREDSSAEFILQDAFSKGEPEYDLVFNAGVLEHYNYTQQLELLKAMASWSRKFVLILIPNANCYWYWIWRNSYSAKNEWPFGKEVPLTDLSDLFSKAGLQFIGQKYFGDSWTEDFIETIAKIDDELRQQILNIHRAGAISSSNTGYLLGALGAISGVEIGEFTDWHSRNPEDSRVVSEMSTSLAELTSINLQNLNQLNELRQEFKSFPVHDKQMGRQFQRKVQSLQRETDRLRTQIDQFESQITDLNKDILSKDELISQLNNVIEETNQKIIELRQINTSTLQTLHQIQSSRAWRLVQLLWKIRVTIAPHNSRRAKLLRYLLNLIEKKRLKSQGTPSYRQSTEIPDYLVRFVTSNSDIRVLLISRVFFDPSGNNMQFGGAERYLIELANVIRSMGYEPVIIQCGNDTWLRYYYDLPVVGIRVGEAYDQFIPELERCSPRGVLAIYSPFELFSERINIPGIGISHGVYWDSEDYQQNAKDLISTIDLFVSKISNLNTLVSVDTNTLNWLRTVDLQLSQKGRYIPNFVDLEEFTAQSDKTHDAERILILFPRRLVFQRGFWLVYEIIPEILNSYPKVIFHFIGKAAPQEQQAITELVEKYPERIQWYFLPPEEMHKVYNLADITLIPTIQSEGTSLSCLEAMAAGNAIIATNVGGLPDLIIHEHNGLLIDPNSNELLKSVRRVIEDADLRSTLGHNAQTVAKSFSIELWQERWTNTLIDILPQKATPFVPPTSKTIVFPYGYGIHWRGVKQRPHHIAAQVVKKGYDVYWYTPEGRQPDPLPNLHLLTRLDELYVEHPVLFIYYPQSYFDIGNFLDPIVIYDILDDISIHDTAGTEETALLARECHEKLLDRADIVIASSRLLVDQIKPRRSDILYIPNAVDVEHFVPKKLGGDLSSTKAPVIGYHGAVASWFDGKLVSEVAKLRPQYQFTIIGPISDENAERYLKSQSNIRIVGPIPYEQLPGYIDEFDVGIMPFKLSALTHAVRPLKILEYLAMQKQVVATPMKEILDWPGVIFAETAEQFAFQIDRALKTGFIDDGAIHNFVQSSTWDKVIQPMVDCLDNKFK